MKTEKAEGVKSFMETGTPADLWDFVHNDTEINPDLCKTVIYQMLFGANLIEVAIEHGLAVDEMIHIRMAFDQYTHEHKKETDAVH